MGLALRDCAFLLLFAGSISNLSLRADARVLQQTQNEALAFSAARAKTDPEARVTALREFLNQFSSDSHSANAGELLLDTYLASFPDRTEAIHTLATAQVLSAPAGFERWVEQARVADMLAAAEPAGADLEDAHRWAQSALDSLTEAAYRHEMASAQIRYKLPKLSAKETHAQYVSERTAFLAAAARVDLRRSQIAQAATLLHEAFALSPLSPEVNALQGQLAMAEGHDQEALAALERADALGALDPTWRAKELALFQVTQHGGEAALEQQIDIVYRSLYPAVFQLPHRQLPSGGHTALLEVFTGSGCAACAGVDLAADSLLSSYAPQDLAILEFDEHIPRPDPLANPDSVARAAYYAVESAPQAFLDGQPVEVLGSSRQDAENIIVGLADAIEGEAEFPSGLALQLIASSIANGEVKAEITLLRTPVSGVPEAETTGDTSLRALARAQVFTALVQDNIRYSGQNGIRFHRMVVRSLQTTPAAAFLGVSPQPKAVIFDVPAISQATMNYLNDFQKSNDRFGAFRFASTDIPLRTDQLAVVTWVQDPVTRHVLQAAFATVSPH